MPLILINTNLKPVYRDLSIVSRLFWVFLVVLMFSFGSILVNRMRIYWDENPTQLLTETELVKCLQITLMIKFKLCSLFLSLLPMEKIPVPAITICNNFVADKWGFLRYS